MVISIINIFSNTEINAELVSKLFTIDGVSHEKLHTSLMLSRVVCTLHGGGIMFSPHYYNTPEEIEITVKKSEDLAANITN